MARRGRRTAQAAAVQEAEFYGHPEAESLLRPDVGTQPQFKKKKPPVTYRYDSSLSQALSWDGQNPARELSVWLIGMIGKTAALSSPHAFDKPQELKRGDGQLVATVRSLQDPVDQLKRLSKPFLNWAGIANNHSQPSLTGLGKLESVDLDPCHSGRRFQEPIFDLVRDLTHDYASQWKASRHGYPTGVLWVP